MRSRSISLLPVLALATWLAGCSGPFLLLPGGALEGEVAPVPDDWGFTDQISTVQIETRPEDPYSVNIWITAAGGALYLHAGANRATWVEHLEADPRLRVRVEDEIFELAATRVTGEDEYATFASAYEAKYGVRPRNENIAEIHLLRLEAR